MKKETPFNFCLWVWGGYETVSTGKINNYNIALLVATFYNNNMSYV